jgi:hypothetical protein
MGCDKTASKMSKMAKAYRSDGLVRLPDLLKAVDRSGRAVSRIAPLQCCELGPSWRYVSACRILWSIRDVFYLCCRLASEDVIYNDKEDVRPDYEYLLDLDAKVRESQG